MTKTIELSEQERIELHNYTNNWMKMMHSQIGDAWKQVVLEMHKRIIADAFKDRADVELKKYFTETTKIVKETIKLINEYSKKSEVKNELDESKPQQTKEAKKPASEVLQEDKK